MAEWVKAAEIQLTLHRWLTSDQGKRWTHNWVAAEKVSEPRKAMFYDMLMHAEAEKLLTGDAIWVAPEMCDLIDVAREQFKPESIEQEDFITHTGFLYFDKPLYLFDRSKRTVSVGAITWCPVVFKTPEGEDDHFGVSIGIYSSARAEEDDFSQIHKNLALEMGACELIPLHLSAVEFGDELDHGQLEDEYGNYTGADEWWRLIQTTLRLMQQRVVVRAEEKLPRPTRRRAERAGHPVREVLIIRLRRATVKTGEETGGDRHFTHRFLRDGHWRWQFYPSLQRHRQIWIHPTIVGDESLPLVIKRRYYKWDR